MRSPQPRASILTTSNLQRHTTTAAVETPRTKIMRYFNQVTAADEAEEDPSVLLAEDRPDSPPPDHETRSPWDPTKDFMPGIFVIFDGCRLTSR
jgi:hypothetical protein